MFVAYGVTNTGDKNFSLWIGYIMSILSIQFQLMARCFRFYTIIAGVVDTATKDRYCGLKLQPAVVGDHTKRLKNFFHCGVYVTGNRLFTIINYTEPSFSRVSKTPVRNLA
jgi:hypothetical protein